ncbi:Beclin-1-like protein B [Diplonema papillatum]|nr:Beclin-1-like protein B [Diplonema papillatum]
MSAAFKTAAKSASTGIGRRSQTVVQQQTPPPPSASAVQQRYYVCQKCRRSFKLVLSNKPLGKNIDGGFLWIEDACAVDLSPIQLHATVSSLLQYASDKTKSDMPLCKECCESVGWAPGGLADCLRTSEHDAQVYQTQLAALESQERAMGDLDEAAEEIEKDLARIEAEEQELLRQLEGIEGEVCNVDKELMRAVEAKRESEQTAAELWQNVFDFAVEHHYLRETIDSYERYVILADEELGRLANTNLLNEAFHIWYEGHFGTINKLRLGRLPSQPVEQNEINAAWGYLAQLLNTLLNIWGVHTAKYRVVPKGSFSVVLKLGPKSSNLLELWAGATGLWASTRYDNAMTGFACCVDDLCKHCINLFPDEVVPCKMEDDRIEGYSVKLSAPSQTDESWTKALKHLLMNLKWLVCMTACHKNFHTAT